MIERRAVVLAALVALPLAGGGALAADEPPTFDVGMQVSVAADGNVASVVPEAGLPAGLNDALVEQVSQWHYTPATWQGKAVAVDTWLSLRLQAVPTTSGGFAVRVLGRGQKGQPRTVMTPPVFPVSALRAGVNALLVYRVHVDSAGSTTPVERLFPKVARGHYKSLDENSRKAIREFRRDPIRADGVAVACDMNYPITFTVGGAEPPPTPELPQPGNACPIAHLETDFEGTML